MVRDVTVKELGIEPVVPRRGAKKRKWGLIAREIPVFCGIVKALAPRRAVELGTAFGLTAEMIREMSPGCQVLSIDYEDHKSERPAELGEIDQAIDFIIADTRVVQLPQDWYGSTDLVFVDAGHMRDNVVNDTRLAISLVSPGGVIIWHDLLLPGGKRDRAKGLHSRHQYYIGEYLYNHLPLDVMRIKDTVLGVYVNHSPGEAEGSLPSFLREGEGTAR